MNRRLPLPHAEHAFIVGLIVAAAFTRLVPHPPNVSPLGAMGLLAGAYLPWRRALAVPLGALLLSDVVLGFYDPAAMLFVYLGLAASVVAGKYIIGNESRPLASSLARILGASCLATAAFFLLSNFGAWLGSHGYSRDWLGLWTCYTAGLFLLRNTLASYMMGSILLFGVAGWAAGWARRCACRRLAAK